MLVHVPIEILISGEIAKPVSDENIPETFSFANVFEATNPDETPVRPRGVGLDQEDVEANLDEVETAQPVVSDDEASQLAQVEKKGPKRGEGADLAAPNDGLIKSETKEQTISTKTKAVGPAVVEAKVEKPTANLSVSSRSERVEAPVATMGSAPAVTEMALPKDRGQEDVRHQFAHVVESRIEVKKQTDRAISSTSTTPSGVVLQESLNSQATFEAPKIRVKSTEVQALRSREPIPRDANVKPVLASNVYPASSSASNVESRALGMPAVFTQSTLPTDAQPVSHAMTTVAQFEQNSQPKSSGDYQIRISRVDSSKMRPTDQPSLPKKPDEVRDSERAVRTKSNDVAAPTTKGSEMAPVQFGKTLVTGSDGPSIRPSVHTREVPRPEVAAAAGFSGLTPSEGGQIAGSSVPETQFRTTVHSAMFGQAGRQVEIAKNVSKQISDNAVISKERVIEIALAPKELGRVQMQVLTTEQGVTIGITADRPETVELMRRHVEILARDFRELGHAQVEFSFGKQGEGFAENRSNNAAQALAFDADEDPDLIANAPIMEASGSRSGLDIKL